MPRPVPPWSQPLDVSPYFRPCLRTGQGGIHSAGRSPGARIINVNVSISASTAAAVEVYAPAGQESVSFSVASEPQELPQACIPQRRVGHRRLLPPQSSFHADPHTSPYAPRSSESPPRSARQFKTNYAKHSTGHGVQDMSLPPARAMRSDGFYRMEEQTPAFSPYRAQTVPSGVVLPKLASRMQSNGNTAEGPEVADDSLQKGAEDSAANDPGEGDLAYFQHDYFQRPEVRSLLRRLRREQPEDLMTWMQAYSKSISVEAAAAQPGPRRASASRFGSQLTEPEEEGSPRNECESAAVLSERSLHAEDAVVFQGASEGVYSYGMLDWRFFIFNAEQEVLDFSRSALRHLDITGDIKPAVSRLHAFLPHTIRTAILSGSIKRMDTQKVVSEVPIMSTYDPVIANFDAAVVFADASGFTRLTESLAQQPNGAEKIGACLNGFFDPLIEIVVRYGGDVLKFSGDALTIIWGGDVLGPAAAAAAASFCCLQIQAQVGSFGETPVPGLKLTLHNGIGFGQLKVLQLGGLMNRWEYCAAGPPLEEVAIAEPLAQPGETVTSPSIQEILQGGEHEECNNAFVFEPVTSDGAPPGYSRLMLRAGAEIRAWDIDPPTTKSILDRTLVERYIPHAIMRRIEGAIDLEAEMRRVSVIFLSVRGLNPGTVASDAVRTQLLLRLLQRSVYALEGSVNKFLVDDKGMLLLVVFGLPPLNHFMDDPLRAVIAAARFTDTLREENLEGRAGVTTGKVWCGVVGSELRREYSVLGDTVNLSARLMAHAAPGTVMVDSPTHHVCSNFLSFQDLGAISVKGKAEKVPAFQFTGELVSREQREQKQLQPKLLSWSGWPVKKILFDAMDSQLVHPDGPSGVVLVHGGSGCGKTEAAELVKSWTSENGFTLLSGQNMSPTATIAVPRLCWQEVFADLVASASIDPHWQRRLREEFPGKSQKHHLFQLLIVMLRDAGAPKELLSWAPLLNLVLPRLDFGPKVVAAMLERDEQHTIARAPRLAEMCAKLLDAFANYGSSTGTVVLLHMKRSTSVFQSTDMHDGFIARAVAELCIQRRNSSSLGSSATNQRRRPLILCIVSRQDAFQHIQLVPDCEGSRVMIDNLSREDTERYMEHFLDSRGVVDRTLVDHVYRVSGGNPFGIEELLQQLEHTNALEVTPDGGVRPAAGLDCLSKLEYPEALVGMEFARFEKLSSCEQEILKAAAIYLQEKGDSNGVFRVVDLAGSLQSMPVYIQEQHCNRLVEQHILCVAAVSRRKRTNRIRKQSPPLRKDSSASPTTDASAKQDGPENTREGKRESRVEETNKQPRRSKTSVRLSFNAMHVPTKLVSSYRFASELLRHVASTLVLQTQRSQIKRFNSRHGMESDSSGFSDDSVSSESLQGDDNEQDLEHP